MARWRQGETVKPEEQVNLFDGPEVTTPVIAPVEGLLFFKIKTKTPRWAPEK